MCGLEPCDICPVQFTKPDKGTHLVDVTAHGFGQFVALAYQRIGVVVDQHALHLQPPQQRVEQRKAFRIRVADHAARKVGKGARHQQAALWPGRIFARREQIGRALGPHDAVWRNPC